MKLSGRTCAAAIAAAVMWALAAAAVAVAQVPANVPVTDETDRAYQGAWLAANPATPGELAVFFQDGNGQPTCWLGISRDAGATWSQVAVVGQGAVKQLPAGYTSCQRGSLAYGPDGTLYFAYTTTKPLTPGPSYNAIYMIVSTDGGRTFRDPVAIDTQPLAEGNVGDQVPRMGTDPATGRLYVAWQKVTGLFTTFDAEVAYSTNRGQTFSAPVRLNDAAHTGGPGMLPAVGPDGRVYVTYIGPLRVASTGPNEPFPVQVATSTDGGVTFSPSVTAQETFHCGTRFLGPNTCAPTTDVNFEGRSNNGPQIAVGQAPNEVYLVSYGLESGAGNDTFRIFFSTSRDAGATWGRPRTIGVPPGLEAHHQFTPTISVAPNGRIDIAYYDFTPTSWLEDTYLISSSDGGRTFSAPRLLSSVPSDTHIRPAGFIGFGQGPFIGSQLVASTDDAIHTAWTDARRGTVSGPITKLDIFSASISLRPPASSPRAPDPTPEPPAEGTVLAPLPTARDATRPVVSGLGIADEVFSIGSLLPRLAAAARVGTTIRFRLSEPAPARLSFARALSGRRVGRSCRRPVRALRRRPRCTRFAAVSPSVVLAGARAGANSVRFQGRLSRSRRLHPGRYRLTVTATDAAGNRSSPRTARFRLIRAPARR